MPKTAEGALLDFFTKAASETYKDPPDGFICPLCLRVFDSLVGLDRAHLWPKALEGRIFTLACRKCNSTVGSSIEKHEVERVKYLRADKLPFTEKIEGVNGQIGLFYSIKDIDGIPTLIMEISGKHSNPLTLAENRRMFDTKEILNRKVILSYRGEFNERMLS